MKQALVSLGNVVVLLTLNNCLHSYASIIRGEQASQKLTSQREENLPSDVLEGKLVDRSYPIYKYNVEKGTISLSRLRRGTMKEDVEKGFKEFSDKIAKLPEQLTGSIKKFFEDRGISVENVQKFLGEIWTGVEKLIDEIKKAM